MSFERFTVQLRPVLGRLFAPISPPEVGAASWLESDRTRTVLVESPQSMANRLEAAAWDLASDDQPDTLAGVPYVRVAQDGEFVTSSRLEAHRLCGAAILDATADGRPVMDLLVEKLGLRKDRPLNYHRLAAAVARLDPLALLHGVFFARKQFFGQPKFTRIVQGLIEAQDAAEVFVGGVKKETAFHQPLETASKSKPSNAGYGPVPFTQARYKAEGICASFAIDTGLLHSYGLPKPVTDFLHALALWEIRSFLDDGLRLRSECHLEPVGAINIPTVVEMRARLSDLLPAARDTMGWDGPWTVQWRP